MSRLRQFSAAFLLFVSAHGAASADDVLCTVKLEACGTLEQSMTPLTKVREGVCVKADLATVGKKPTGLYYSAIVWIGVSVSGDTLVFGKGEAKSGVALECSWNLEKPKPKQQIDSLKASLPQLLKNERFHMTFPGIKKIDVSKLKLVDDADMNCADALAAFTKAK